MENEGKKSCQWVAYRIYKKAKGFMNIQLTLYKGAITQQLIALD